MTISGMNYIDAVFCFPDLCWLKWKYYLPEQKLAAVLTELFEKSG